MCPIPITFVTRILSHSTDKKMGEVMTLPLPSTPEEAALRSTSCRVYLCCHASRNSKLFKWRVGETFFSRGVCVCVCCNISRPGFVGHGVEDIFWGRVSFGGGGVVWTF